MHANKLEPGELVSGRYRVDRLIARGMADIFEATDAQSERRLALKILSPKSEQSAELRDRIVREAEALGRLEHPNVVRIQDSGRHGDGSFYLVLELLSGQSLGSRLKHDGPLSEREALPLFLQAAEALEAAHREQIVHRDVKPDNLFLCGERGGICLKLLDFGLAQLPDHDHPGDPLVLGTAAYMAPEQVVGDPTDPRSDVYSLGVVMFRALTNELPFDTPGHAPLLAHQLLSTAPPPSWLAESLSPELDKIVTSALRKHPDNRYPSMQAMRQDLERVWGGGEALGSELVVGVDRYQPTTTLGRQALDFLGKHHGHLAAPWRDSDPSGLAR